jgi:hypothetical protein
MTDYITIGEYSILSYALVKIKNPTGCAEHPMGKIRSDEVLLTLLRIVGDLQENNGIITQELFPG